MCNASSVAAIICRTFVGDQDCLVEETYSMYLGTLVYP